MDKDLANGRIFIIIGLFLLGVALILWLAQVLYWVIVKIKNHKKPKKNQYYQDLLAKHQYHCQVKKVKFVVNFFNYNSKNDCLKLNNNDYIEKTNWNLYRNLLHILLIKWKKDKKKTALSIILTIISFYLSAILIITCALIYLVNWKTGNLNNLNTQVLSIFCFIGLLALILTWVTWTMIFEKVRKELLLLAEDLDPKTLKVIKNIVSHKTLYPGSELLF